MTRIWPLPCEGLGNNSYLAEVADGLALAVDPGRDPRPYLGLAAAHGLRVAFTADTHVHADFVSGGRELAAGGARLLAPAGSGLSFGHEELRDGEDLDLGGLMLRALATPGHTPEHLSYLLLDGGQPVAVFTGGALIVGGVARTDLADPARAEDWTRAAYRSARALLGLPGDLAAYPTHGPGSFCSAGETGEHVTTIGRERDGNPLLAGAGEDAFTRQVLARLGSYPAYFARLPAVNRRGAPRHGTSRPVLAALTPAHVAELAAGGATIVDARPISEFAAAHIPGSLSDELRPAFATWLGWLASPDRPLIAVLGAGQDRGELVEAALLVGYDNLAGELDGGIDAWRAAGLPTASIPLLDAATDHIPDGSRVLDVRQRGEWMSGHLPGAVHAELGGLVGPAGAAGLPDGPVAVMCGHGERAMTGASLLAAGPGGAAAVSVLRGGPGDWAKAAGQALAHG
jgi:glyoxylase-like metal-dependent hydrolase (beta-lactamase superfamily II)/rhodanese-related sulfurtransferase